MILLGEVIYQPVKITVKLNKNSTIYSHLSLNYPNKLKLDKVLELIKTKM